jgi:Sporulation related domain.
MKKLLMMAFMLLLAGTAFAQNIPEVDVDSLLNASQRPDVDSVLAGRDLMSVVLSSEAGSGKVTIEQPAAVKKGLTNHISNNSSIKIRGYRVRIYFDNAQNARNVSQSVAASFSAMYPGMAVYRTHESPYFKVTVGNFRTRHDAQRFANAIRGTYPSVFLVRETISYPSF